MSRVPDFSELVGDDLPPEERERLRRVHDLLIAAGPPADLPPSLAEPPSRAAPVVALRQGRRRAVALLAAALLAASFAAGYWAGARDGESRSQAAFEVGRAFELRGTEEAPSAFAVVRVGRRDALGNLPMLVTVEGIHRLPRGDYYTLYMTKRGKRLVTCGTFNVAGGSKRTTVRMSVAYDLRGFDGFAITEYRKRGHSERDLLTGRLTA